MTDPFRLEKEHLDAALTRIRREEKLSADEVSKAYEALMSARSSDPDALPLRETQYLDARLKQRHLTFSLQKPYFTRIDFTESGGDALRCYIGKYGVMDSAAQESIVYDWRAPIANLYYCGQLGHVSYTAPDGKIEGELTLKRQFEIEAGQLISVFDTDIVNQDRYLQKALSARSGDKLKDIVSTIQSEQNLIIRHPFSRSLLVQGAAGSGKTTVALHRIAYLLYAYADRLKPERMLILAPNPLFLDYISEVLPDLGVEHTGQSTYAAFFSEWLRLKKPLADPVQRLNRLTNSDEENRALLSRISLTKGSLAFRDALEEYLKRYERQFIPENGVVFGPVPLWTRAEAERFLTIDEGPFPMSRRVEEFKKQLTKRANAAVKNINAWFKAECDRRGERIRASYTGEEQKARLRALYESRDTRIRETADHVKPFVEEVLSHMPSTDPQKVYRAFLTELADSENELFREAAAHTLAAKALTTEDLAPLTLISLLTRENDHYAYRHIVIDEAQDLSPFQIYALKRCQPEAHFTLVGDLMQGITANRGIRSWAELSENVFKGECDYAELTTSYRSTAEIMNEAFKASRGRQDQARIRVIRNGAPCVYQSIRRPSERAQAIAQAVSLYRSEGYESIAVITHDGSEAEKLLAALPEALNARLLNGDSAHFERGLYIASAGEVKGLEFDGVILADASVRVYPDTDHDARLLYVAITRALHRLTVLYTGSLTPLLL